MDIKPIKTRPFLPPKDSLSDLLEAIPIMKEKSVIVITSKVISICQGRCISINSVKNKDELIKKEADFYLDREEVPNKWVMLTIKNNILIPTAGIDESNGNGYYILWPANPFGAARQIYDFLKKKFSLRELGIIISDSHTTPLRWGATGIAISSYGFNPLKDYRGSKDIFGREMKITQANVADSIASAATLVMGEGNEQTPLAIVEDTGFIEFQEMEAKEDQLKIDRHEDIYGPLLNNVNWKSQPVS